jgi:integrase
MKQPRLVTPLHEVISQAPDLAASSRDKYLRDVDDWIAYAGSDPVNWTRANAQDFYNGLLERISPQSANRLMSSVSYASRWWAHRLNNPTLDFAIVRKASVKASGDKRHALSQDQVIRLLETTRAGEPIDLRDRALMIVGLETGMRRMSLEGMRYENFRAEPYPRVLVPIKGYGETLYSVPLTDTALASLNDWNGWLATHATTKSGAVFRRVWSGLTAKGVSQQRTRDIEPISSEMIHRTVGGRAKLAGIPHVHPHLFRHTFVTSRVEAGHDDAHIAAITGHSLSARSGALGNYKDMLAIGAVSRNYSPRWLADWARST